MLFVATAIAVSSFCLLALPGQLFSYLPILLGCFSMLLCILARRRAVYKDLVTLYMILLSPFAFCYPAWFLLFYVVLASGYQGPMS